MSKIGNDRRQLPHAQPHILLDAARLTGKSTPDHERARLNYRSDMRAIDKAPKTINRRLAAIRSLVKLGRLTGAVYWSW